MQIRNGSVRDWPFIQQLALEAITYSLSPLRGVDDDYAINYRKQTLAGFWAWLQRSQSRVFIAEEKERLGYLILNDRTNDELTGLPQAWVMDIAVIKSAWSQGVGKLLMERAEEYCREHEIKFIGLAVTSSNQRAVSLYESIGYTEERKLMLKQLF